MRTAAAALQYADDQRPRVVDHTDIDTLMSAPASFRPSPVAFMNDIYDEWKTDDEAAKATRAGRAWPATLKSYTKAQSAEPIEAPTLRHARRCRVWDDLTGDTADVGRALVAIAPWEQYRREAHKRSVTIGICSALSVTHGASNFNSNAVTSVCLVDSLLAAGYDVRVLMIYGGCYHAIDNENIGWFATVVPVKDYGQPFDQEKTLAYCQQAFVRRFTIARRRQVTGSPETVLCIKYPADFIKKMGVDILVARQWSEGTEQEFQRKIFSEVEEITNA